MDKLKPRSLLLLKGNLISIQWIREFSELSRFSILVHEVPLHGKDGVWCAMSASWVIGTIFLETINSYRCVTHVLIPIFLHTCLIMGDTMIFYNKTLQKLTWQTILCVVWRVFLAQNSKYGIVFPCSTDLNPCDRFFYLRRRGGGHLIE